MRQRKNKQSDPIDAEKGSEQERQPRPKGRERSATEASRQRKDPESRAWKDDVRSGLSPATSGASRALTAIPTIRQIVTFDSADDPANPKNWTFRHKTFIVMLFGMTTMSSTYASSSISSALGPISTEFGISREVSILAISLFSMSPVLSHRDKLLTRASPAVLGYVPGPIIFAPLSEREYDAGLPYVWYHEAPAEHDLDR